MLLGVLSGCATTRWAVVRSTPFNPLTQQLALDSLRGPSPTARTLQTLRRQNLASLPPDQALAQLQEIATGEPTADNVYAIAEVAYVQAASMETKKRKKHDESKALSLYGTSVANAYFYLFDNSLQKYRNPYDPRFRRACDLYNTSLEKGLRYLQQNGLLRPGQTSTIETDGQVFDVTIAARQTWHEQHFDDLKFVSDFEVKELRNHFHQYGLGVPMIAVYRPSDPPTAADKLYPPGMTFPVTVFMRVIDSAQDAADPRRVRHRCVLELYDPTLVSEVVVGDEPVPLETDLTTPLAYALDNPAFRQANVPSRGLRDGESSSAISGLFMLEPYDPRKIPVVMVHGFWSSLVTWMEMFNDLRSSPELRDHYQFWFYLYPTGQPFWYSAAHLRQALAHARQTLDPSRQAAALDQMVLVGHSMGGLLATMQTMAPAETFWALVSDKPLEQLDCTPEVRDNLAQTFFFSPNPSVQRVITIATPLRGSEYSNGTTQWLGRKLINLPAHVVSTREALVRQNPGYFSDKSLLNATTAVESLDTSSPVWNLLHDAEHAPWVRYHNIIGNLEDCKVLGAVAGKSDGVVSTDSARCSYAASEIVVRADHVAIHREPATILEVRRVLLEHLGAIQANQSSAMPWEVTRLHAGRPQFVVSVSQAGSERHAD